MKKSAIIFFASLACGAALAATEYEKNIADVAWRTLPADYENLSARESAAWNWNFRPYGAESASFLWSDPNVIREAASGVNTNTADEATGIYVSCNQYGMTLLFFGSRAKKGGIPPNECFELFFLPGDADNPQIKNYNHFGINSKKSVKGRFGWSLSWQKPDRENNLYVPHLVIDSRETAGGTMLSLFVPWEEFWADLPVFQQKTDNFWRLSAIRWGGSKGGVTWGGPVHQQSQAGYLRMPNFTDEQRTLILSTVLYALWNDYSNFKDNFGVNLSHVTKGDITDYRKSIHDLPHTVMNYNEDFAFRDAWLTAAIAERDAFGETIANFKNLSRDEQDAFYKHAAPLLANFKYDLSDAYAEFIKAKLIADK